MGILGLLIAGVLNLVLLAVDVTVFFLVVRVLRVRLDWGFLKRLDRVGSPLTDGVAAEVRKKLQLVWGRHVSERDALAFSLLAFLMVRMVLGLVVMAVV